MLLSHRQSSFRETTAALGVLAVLAAVGVWLVWQQGRFSPAVTVAANAAHAVAALPPEPAPVPTMAPLLASWPAGLQPMSPSETFTAETLSDKIDGKAELYLSAGVTGMRCQRISAGGSAWLEAFVYDMAKPENAFAVYSSQKRTATQDAGVGDYGYRAGNQLCVVHGQYYLEFVGADDSEHTGRAALELARAFIADTAVARHADMARDESLFPPEAMIGGSVMLLSADVFGFDQLDHTYVARYQDAGDTVTVFLSRRASPAEATRLAAALRGFFVNDCGGTAVSAPAHPVGVALIDTSGSFDGVFATGTFVAGVHQAPSRAAAERWLQKMAARLPSSTP